EQWKDFAHRLAMLNVTKDQHWFEIDRAHALGQSNYGGEGTSTQSCYDQGENWFSRKRPATSHDAAVDDTQTDYVPLTQQEEAVPRSQLTQLVNSCGVGYNIHDMSRILRFESNDSGT
ncbi:hypothetical protein MKW92_049221, partial [Papaver armeniacum]